MIIIFMALLHGECGKKIVSVSKPSSFLLYGLRKRRKNELPRVSLS